MTAPVAEVRFRVGWRFRCTLRLERFEAGGCHQAVAEWEPQLPRRLSPRELKDYRAGRAQFMATVAEHSRLPAACMEV